MDGAPNCSENLRGMFLFDQNKIRVLTCKERDLTREKIWTKTKGHAMKTGWFLQTLPSGDDDPNLTTIIMQPHGCWTRSYQ